MTMIQCTWPINVQWVLANEWQLIDSWFLISLVVFSGNGHRRSIYLIRERTEQLGHNIAFETTAAADRIVGDSIDFIVWIAESCDHWLVCCTASDQKWIGRTNSPWINWLVRMWWQPRVQWTWSKRCNIGANQALRFRSTPIIRRLRP